MEWRPDVDVDLPFSFPFFGESLHALMGVEILHLSKQERELRVLTFLFFLAGKTGFSFLPVIRSFPTCIDPNIAGDFFPPSFEGFRPCYGLPRSPPLPVPVPGLTDAVLFFSDRLTSWLIPFLFLPSAGKFITMDNSQFSRQRLFSSFSFLR